MANGRTVAVPKAGVRLALTEGAITEPAGQAIPRLKTPVPDIGVTTTVTALVTPLVTTTIADPAPIGAPPALTAVTDRVQVPLASRVIVTLDPVVVEVNVAPSGPVPVIVYETGFMSVAGASVRAPRSPESETTSPVVSKISETGELQATASATTATTHARPANRHNGERIIPPWIFSLGG